MPRPHIFRLAGLRGLGTKALGTTPFFGGMSPLTASIGSTLTQSCVASWRLSDLTDATGRGNTLTNNNSATFNTGKIGNAAYFNGSNQFLSIADNADVSLGNVDWAIGLWFYANDFLGVGGASVLIAKDVDTPSNSRDYTVDVLPTGEPRFYINGGATIITTWGSAVSTGAWHCALVWHDSVNDLIGLSIDNGTPVTFTTSGTAPETSAAPLRIGARAYTSFEGFLNGRIDNVWIWEKVLTPSERTEFFNGGAGVDFPGSGVTNYTLSAASGVFTETGTAVGLRVARQLAAVSGTFTETGTAVGLRVGRKIAAASGTFVETGIAASLRAARTLSSASGTFTLTGTSAGLRVGRMLTAASGSYLLTGTAAALIKTGGYTLTASSGSFALSGTAAGLKTSRRAAASSGSFALTGSSAGLRVARALPALSGTFSLNGTSATVSVGRKLTANSGTFIHTGQAANLRASRVLTVSSGSFVFTGTVATLTYDTGIDRGPERSASVSVLPKPTATLSVIELSATLSVEPKPSATIIVEGKSAGMSVLPKPSATLTKWV